jgi:hypothetical protein
LFYAQALSRCGTPTPPTRSSPSKNRSILIEEAGFSAQKAAELNMPKKSHQTWRLFLKKIAN